MAATELQIKTSGKLQDPDALEEAALLLLCAGANRSFLEQTLSDETKAILEEQLIELENMSPEQLYRKMSALKKQTDKWARPLPQTTPTLSANDQTKALKAIKEANNLAGWLKDENDQIASFALSKLSPHMTSLILQRLPVQKAATLLTKMAELQPTSATSNRLVLKLIESAQSQSSHHASPTMDASAIGSILRQMPQNLEDNLIETLQTLSPELAARIDQASFTFEDVLNLEHRTLSEILSDIELSTIGVALKTLPDNFQEKMLGAVSPRAARVIEEHLHTEEIIPTDDIQKARAEIIKKAKPYRQKS